MQHVGIGEPGRQWRPRNVAGQRGEGAALRGGRQGLAVEIIVQRGVGFLRGAQPGQQAVSHSHDLGEQVVLRGEMRVEGAARQAGGQHDVVDVGPGMPAQPEQPGGMLDDLGPDGGLAGGADGHDMLSIILYDGRHIIVKVHFSYSVIPSVARDPSQAAVKDPSLRSG